MNEYIMILYGIIVGSFLSICVYRIPKGLQIMEGKSICPQCGHTLSVLDTIPLISYLFLMGKCHYCNKKISFRYPFLELVNGMIYGLVYYTYGDQIETILFCAFLSIMMVLAILDKETLEVPTSGLLLILLLGVIATCTITTISYYNRFISMFIMSIPFFLLSFFKEGSIGMGDILYAGCAGLLLGSEGILISILIAYLFSIIVSLIKLIKHKLKRNTPIAMFSYFLIGNLTYILYGSEIINLLH